MDKDKGMVNAKAHTVNISTTALAEVEQNPDFSIYDLPTFQVHFLWS